MKTNTSTTVSTEATSTVAATAPTVSASALAIADKICGCLWDASVTIVESLTFHLADLSKATGHDPKLMGAAIAEVWATMGGEVKPPCRVLADACFAASVTRKDAYAILKATDWVSKGRITQILACVYEGKSNKEVKNESGILNPESETESPDSGNGFTVAQIVAAIASLPSLTKEDARTIALACQAKLGA